MWGGNRNRKGRGVRGNRNGKRVWGGNRNGREEGVGRE